MKMKELTIDATIPNIETVTDFVNKELEELGCPLKAQIQIDIAIDELFSNISNYAYNPETGTATVQIEVSNDPLAVILTFMDNGKPYDPLKRQDPDTATPLEERDMGGLGIYIVKQSMDDISYEYRDGMNILKIKKKF